jgi:hypothetical protein
VLARIANSPLTDWRPPQGDGCNDGSIPRDPAGAGPPYPPPGCLSLHIRPLGICSRFADRGLPVFVIEGLPLPPIFWRARVAARSIRRISSPASSADSKGQAADPSCPSAWIFLLKSSRRWEWRDRRNPAIIVNMGQRHSNPWCEYCGRQKVLLLPTDGERGRELRCIKCDVIDPLKLPSNAGWIDSELRPPK